MIVVYKGIEYKGELLNKNKRQLILECKDGMYLFKVNEIEIREC